MCEKTAKSWSDQHQYVGYLYGFSSLRRSIFEEDHMTMRHSTGLVTEPLLPHPSAIIESMRNIGYRPETAIADLVDNSITAQATTVNIEICPVENHQPGWVRIEDNGHGMSQDELIEAMRWGGNGPKVKRKYGDLGRFGLGLKTASFSFGRRLTVLSKKGGILSTYRWDLNHIENAGWDLLEGLDADDKKYLDGTNLLQSGKNSTGTIVLVTSLDRLRISGGRLQETANRTALFRGISDHLGLVFHRFIDSKKLKLKLGSATVPGWNLFSAKGLEGEKKWLRSEENLQAGTVKVSTYVLPHYKSLTEHEYDRLEGPLGWNAHQGFIVFRADRLIVPGGWLGFEKSQEQYKLARIAIDLPNSLDEAWGLNVMKSKVSPPAIVRGDLERIGAAARRDAVLTSRFHGEKEATSLEESGETTGTQAFWKQVNGKRDVHFRINKRHPLVEALVQSSNDKEFADAFLHAFERLLPIAAILQNPKKTTDALAVDPTETELNQLAIAVEHSVKVLMKMGRPEMEAVGQVLAVRPFAHFSDSLREKYEKKQRTNRKSK